MGENKGQINAAIDDIELIPLGFSAQTICQGVDGSIFYTMRGKLYCQGPDESHFSQLCHMDDAYHANILAFDNAGHLYYAGKYTGELKRSTDYGKTFSICLKDGGGDCFRGFTINSQGVIYTGSYGPHGPASLYCSGDDGDSWTAIQNFRCRHIHDVRINPENDWLYVVTGELYDSQILDAYGVFRSKDGGQTWTRIVAPAIQNSKGWGRPLYLSIGFIGNQVALSTDHPEGGNGLDIFTDTGEDRLFQPRRVISYLEPRHMPEGPPPYCWGFSRQGAYLYTVCCGDQNSIIYRSIDGDKWEECALMPPMTSQKPEILGFENGLFLGSYKGSYVIQPKKNAHNDVEKDAVISLCLSTLLAHDQRYADNSSSTHCRGYFARSMVDKAKQDMILAILNEYDVPKTGLIADVGCGVGAALIACRAEGYTGLVGIDANPRWLIGARRMYEKAFPGETPALRLAPRGIIVIPAFSVRYSAVLLLGVFVGKGHSLNPEQTLDAAHKALGAGGLICFNVSPTLLGENTVDIFLQLAAKLGFKNMRCRKLRDTFYISAIKS